MATEGPVVLETVGDQRLIVQSHNVGLGIIGAARLQLHVVDGRQAVCVWLNATDTKQLAALMQSVIKEAE